MKNIIYFIIFALVFPLVTQALELTDQEKEFIDNNPKIKIALMPDFTPFSFIKNNKIVGFEHDLLQIISQKTGIKFEEHPAIWNKNLKAFKEKKVDMITSISYNKEREAFTTFTTPYYNIPIMIFVRDDFGKYEGLKSLEGKKIGILKDIFYENALRKYTNNELHIYDTYDELTEALVFGKIDALIQNFSNINYLIKKNLYTNLVLADELQLPEMKKEDLRFGINPDKPLLHSIIQKALNSIDEDTWATISNRWLGVKLIDHEVDKQKNNSLVSLTQEEKSFLKSNPVIRVHNEKYWPPYNFNENGKPLGYSIDTMNLIAKKIGIKVDYVTGPTWNEFLGMMQNGSLDVILNIVKTPERFKYLLYTKPYANNPNVILSKSEKPYKDIKSLFGKTVAIPKGFFTEEIITKDYPQINLLPLKDTLEIMKAVAFGKADAALGEMAVFNYLMNEHMMSGLSLSGESIIGNPDFSLLHIATRKDLPILASILNKGVEAITVEEKRALQIKWFGKSDNIETALSLEENEYLESKQEIKMCAIPDILPLEQIDENEKHQGIAEDVIQIVSKKINKKIVLVPTSSWTQSLENIKNKKCDILPIAMSTQNRQKYMNFTTPYLSETLVVATKHDKFFIEDSSELKNRKIGIVKSYVFTELLKQKHPDIEIVDVKDAKDGLKQVEDGKLFGYVDTLPSIAYAIQKEGLFDLKVAGKLEFDAKFSVATRKDEPLLNSIIQKALNNIGEEEIRSIVGKWVSIKVEQSFDYKKLIYVSLFFLVLLSVVLYKNRSIKSLNKKLEELSITDNLTKLYNRNKIDEVLKAEANRANRFKSSFAVIMLDIDYFKRVNDIHGHQMGDTILKEFAQILKTSLRKTDTVGRWGGEEFMIVCSETDLMGATSLANNIREKIATYPFSLGEQKTASFGIAIYIKNEDIKNLIKRADDALYKAKENGRNKVEIDNTK